MHTKAQYEPRMMKHTKDNEYGEITRGRGANESTDHARHEYHDRARHV